MHIADILILASVGVLAVLALRSWRRQGGGCRGCGGHCDGCAGCQTPPQAPTKKRRQNGAAPKAADVPTTKR